MVSFHVTVSHSNCICTSESRSSQDGLGSKPISIAVMFAVCFSMKAHVDDFSRESTTTACGSRYNIWLLCLTVMIVVPVLGTLSAIIAACTNLSGLTVVPPLVKYAHFDLTALNEMPAPLVLPWPSGG
eukprot:765445-Hanusia_phi.AAC.1